MPIEIHKIEKTSENNFWVRTVAGNGEILSTTELFSTKQKAQKNIIAQIKAWGGTTVFVQEKFGAMKEYFLTKDGSKHSK